MNVLTLQKPLASPYVDAIRTLHTVSSELGVPFLIVGATADLIISEHVHGDASRGTHDIDFAVALHSWDVFDTLKTRIVGTGLFSADPRLAHRLRSTRSAMHIDLIPFGQIADANAEIRWPPGDAEVMNVLGFEEALHSAERVEIEAGLIVPVASQPGFALLKIFAWRDRGRNAAISKDAGDIVRIIDRYQYLERIYTDVPHDVQEAHGFEPERVGAWLLGREVGSIASARTRAELIGLLDEAGIGRIAAGGLTTTVRSGSKVERNIALMRALADGIVFTP